MKSFAAFGAVAFAIALGAGLFLTTPLFSQTADEDSEIEAPVEVASYAVSLEGSPSEEVTEDLTAALALYRYQEEGAPSIALLRRRALDDRETGRKVLRSHGYYKAEVGIDLEPNDDESGAQVTVTVEPGPVFELERHDFVLTPTPLAEALPKQADSSFGSPVGGAASAAAILDAESAAVA